jgi:hypothetical protein
VHVAEQFMKDGDVVLNKQPSGTEQSAPQ